MATRMTSFCPQYGTPFEPNICMKISIKQITGTVFKMTDGFKIIPKTALKKTSIVTKYELIGSIGT